MIRRARRAGARAMTRAVIRIQKTETDMDLRFFVILHEYLLLLSASALACDLESSHGS